MSGIGSVQATWGMEGAADYGAGLYGGQSGSRGAVLPTGNVGNVQAASPLERTRAAAPGQPAEVQGAQGKTGTQETKEAQKAECQTCKERKYMDQSNEGNVSFQSPTHIAPGQAAARVMSHEREHVRNAVAEGQKENKKLVSVSVSLKTGVCPECGRTYIAGGTTHTKMLTYRENPYDQGRKAVEGTVLRGMNVDQRV